MVEFRHINGRNVPIRNVYGAARGSISQQGRFVATEATCFLIRCPERCGQDVFFIRHNGGSVWIDAPLGYPWNKHKCMHPDEARVGRGLALVSLPRINTRSQRARLLLGVVTKAGYLVGSTKTLLHFAAGEDDIWSATVKNDCQRLLGELIIVDPAARTVVRFDTPNFLHRLLSLNRLT